jgi:hypothetical protein
MFDFDVVSGPVSPTRLPKRDERPRAAAIPGSAPSRSPLTEAVHKKAQEDEASGLLAGADPPAG